MRGTTDGGGRTTSPGQGRRGGRRPSRTLPAAALLLAVAVLSLGTACGGSSGGSPAGGPAQDGGPTETYTNAEYRFSITCGSALTQGDPSEGNGAGAVFAIAFVDTEGPRAGKAYTDGVQVAVFKLARTVTPDEVRGLEQQVRDTVDERVTSLQSGRVVEPVTRTTVNGTPGFTVSYRFARDGTAVAAVSTFLFSGEYQYELTGQASEASRATVQPVVDAAMASFTVTE